jgi:hypothetical protein
MRWLLAPLTAAAFVAGVWVAGGVVTDKFKVAMALTALWFAASGATVAGVAIRRRALAAPLVAGFGVAALAVGGYLGVTTLRDKVVHEDVAVAGVAGTVHVASGTFRSVEHASSGKATVVRLRGGRQLLTLTAFDTSAGPDLRIRLVPGGSTDGGADGHIDLGALKGNRGDQQYQLPSGVDVQGRTVVVWCRAFSVAFAAARLA